MDSINRLIKHINALPPDEQADAMKRVACARLDLLPLALSDRAKKHPHKIDDLCRVLGIPTDRDLELQSQSRPAHPAEANNANTEKANRRANIALAIAGLSALGTLGAFIVALIALMKS